MLFKAHPKELKTALCFEPLEVLYKYTRSEYTKGILEQGTFKIGTLHEYKEYEGNKEIRDDTEGVLQFPFMGKEEILNTSEDDIKRIFFNHAHYRDRDRAYLLDRLKDVEDDVIVGLQIEAPDCYVFCTSKVFDIDVMKAFDCDACIEIKRPHAFFQEMSKIMHPYSYFGIMESCIYGNKFGLSPGHSIKAQKLKEKSFEHQKEVRMLWDSLPTSPESKLKPKIISSPKLAKLCKRIF